MAQAEIDTSPRVTEVLGKVDELPPGTKKIFVIKDKPVLVINDNGNYYGITGMCSYYDSLEQGVYYNGRIRCALHGACYNVKTGELEDYPALDSLYTYDVKEQDGNIVLTTTEKQLQNIRRTRMPKFLQTRHDDPIVIVGGGISASTFVEHVRMNGCQSPIIIVTSEGIQPYNRVLLTKVHGFDSNRRSVAMSTGKRWRYSKLVLALGVVPKKLDVPGADLKNIYTLRVPHEANAIAKHAEGKRVVCIGGSFLATEIASTLCHSSKSSVTIVCEKEEPLPALGPDIGAAVRKRFEEKGVRVLVNQSVKWFIGQDTVSGVVITSGDTVPADVVVVAIGVKPPTDWLRDTPVELDENGFIKVDCNFKTTAKNVYAIGDVVSAPLPLWGIDSINIQHLQTAQSHGQMLGYSILGYEYPHELVPFYWVAYFFEFGIQFSGESSFEQTFK
ncbi:Pyridine nucleotide-disulfide oxidoreductase [Trichostrongylus colubriformis]|uniref:Pyridine nucleotide-disulfide oxidoreductase n=1 Tax=Trichostrongylus colubriformis TaxID=6319 RepID=A0AAN8F0D6_TRICO